MRLTAKAGRLVVDDVSFAYTPGVDVLKHVSFTVESGQRIGIVGATGSGKSTLINLLLRFYDVSSGRILLDGTDIREMALADLRSHFALVLQDVYLFSGTIAGNIRLGRDDITDAQVREAAQAVHADAFIQALPGRVRDARGRARRDAVGGPEAAAVVCPRAGVRPDRSSYSTRRRRAWTPRPSC